MKPASDAIVGADQARYLVGLEPPRDARVEALRKFNAALVGEPRLRGVALTLGDGVGYAVRQCEV